MMDHRSFRIVALAVLAGLPRAVAHIALWHPSLYGWEDNNIIQSDPDLPLQGMNFADWWFHGWIDSPPDDGVYMELPAGGTFHGEVNCAKSFTTYGEEVYPLSYYACPTEGQMHMSDHFGQDVPYDVRGCGLGIAYKSDVYDIKPEDFTIISTNYTCPWTREVDFQIPADLPPCPEGGCHCTWGWIHAPWAGSEQMYHLGYRCNVTGATGTVPLPAPQVARKCPIDTTNCTVGSKQPHYWYQNEGNNNFQDPYDPPYYNGDYGFANGAQTDLFDAVSTTVAYTQTSWVTYELYYTNSPPASISISASPDLTVPYPVTQSTTTNSITPGSSVLSISTTTSISSQTPSPSPASTSVASLTTTSATGSAAGTILTTPTSTPSSAKPATKIGSPTSVLVNNNAAVGTASSPSASLVLGGSAGAVQCPLKVPSRAAKRLEDPELRRMHELRAERRRLRRRSAAAESLKG